MEVSGIEMISRTKVPVFLGRAEHISDVLPKHVHILSWYPDIKRHFTEYPEIAKTAYEEALAHNGASAIATQNREFLDALLNSDFDLQIITVREDPKYNKYRLRVMERQHALHDRESFDMELRI